jgi:hypothetical protein
MNFAASEGGSVAGTQRAPGQARKSGVKTDRGVGKLLGKPGWAGIGAIAGIVGALAAVIAIVIAVLPSGPQARQSTSGGNSSGKAAVGASTGPALSINLYHQTMLDDPEVGVTAFPTKLSLTPAELKTIDAKGLTSWLAGRHGWEKVTDLKLTLTGRRYIQILNMRAKVLTRTKPVSGTLFQPFQGGGGDLLSFFFNLDSVSPVASSNLSCESQSCEYFQTHDFSLRPGEQHVFKLQALSARFAVRWVIDVTVLDRNKVVHYLIKDTNGLPFQTTAAAPGYQVIYASCETVLTYRLPATGCHGNTLPFQWVRTQAHKP